ncbi:MAG: peptidylprolyl isomerase [Alphaproteobacteria bacterium]|nr:peptidylprolyl isomerase [Alphaproteobacteria bacterium]
MHPRLSITPLGLICAAALAAAACGGVVLAADRPAPQANPGAATATPLPPGSTVVARVDGTELHLSDVEAAQQSLPPQVQKMPLAQIYPMLLDRLVDGLLITEAGRKAHLDQDPEVQQRLKRYEDRLIQEAYLNKAIKDAETEDRLKARYDTFAKDKAGREEVHARHILVKTEAEAKSVIGELEKGADFAELAKKYSTDPGGSSGGDLGYFGHDDMVKEFADAAFALPAGQYTKTPVKTQFGWHVILVEDHRVSTPPSFDEARQEVTQLVAHDAVDTKLKELRAAAKVETYGLDGKPLPPSGK